MIGVNFEKYEVVYNKSCNFAYIYKHYLFMIQAFVNKHFFNLFIFTITFGILLYDFIGFDYTDEICALFLFVIFGTYVSKIPEWPFNKAFCITIGVFLFYLLYSFLINSNSKGAIISDFLIQIKPYLAFFCVYSMIPIFSIRQNSILRYLTSFFAIFLLIVGSINVFTGTTLRAIMGHEAYFAAAIVSFALTYLLSADFNNKSKFIYILILSVGLLSTRSKFYGFYILSIASILYFTKVDRFKLNAKSIILLCIIMALMGIAAWDKINLYFVQGFNIDNEKDFIARFVLYATSIQIFQDYFPFGSGFASFATFSSGEYYSHIYEDYDIDSIWGLSKQFHSYVADTYYPSLAQFGVVGVILYCSFWLYIVLKAYKYFKVTHNIKLMLMALLITCYFTIESTSDSTYTTHRGFFIMMILGYVLSNMKHEALQTIKKSDYEHSSN